MKTRISRRTIGLTAAIVVLLAAAALFLLSRRTGAHVTIGGLDVSELTIWEAWQTVEQAEDALREKSLTISLPEETLTLGQEELGLRISGLSLAWEAWRAGESIPLTLRMDEKALQVRLEAYAAQYDTTLTPGAYRMEGSLPALDTQSYDPDIQGQTLVLNPGTPECHLDVAAAIAAVKEFYSELFVREDYRVTLEVTPSALPEALDLEAIYGEFRREAVNDSLDMQTYQLVPGAYGYDFDLEAAAADLAEAPWGQDMAIPMEAVSPEILGEGVYFRDLLGHCETKHTTDENRNTNLRLVCEILDGLILQPGETFSYNGAVGERTEERGFRPAGAYSGNRLIKDIGGGVCQGSTTLYNCALLADLEIIERNCHGFTVTYVPIGLDAAVNWATRTDLQFRNNWNFPIRIHAEVSDGYMRMELWGTDEKDYYIEMTSTRSDGELRIYSNSYKNKYDKETGELISQDLAARSAYMYFEG